MTPKEKAIELVEKYYHLFSLYIDNPIANYEAKECALIAVDEILNEFPKGFNGNFEMKRKLYWQEVKQEIEN